MCACRRRPRTASRSSSTTSAAPARRLTSSSPPKCCGAARRPGDERARPMSGRSGRRPLGRGLAALLGEGAPAPDAAAPAPRLVPTERIRPGPLQPRRRFAEEELAALARSIREKGVLQPLLVRPCGDAVEESFELVAGERRWRAARQIGLAEVPVVVRALGDSEALEVALVENLQREDLSPL